MTANGEMLAELLQAALNELEDGVALLDAHSHVLFWNPTAAAITGYRAADLLSRGLPENFYQVDTQHPPGQAPSRPLPFVPGPRPGAGDPDRRSAERAVKDRPILVHLHHKLGHSLPVMLRRTPLRDSLGKRFGTLIRFHPVEEIDTLPHGAIDHDSESGRRIEENQAAMEDRLDEAWQEWSRNEVPFGLLWINVDQAEILRKTHGRDASEAMLAIVERTLFHGLRPTEILGRWGNHEFLVLCHERTDAMLESHANHVVALARTADFRWWGDRIPLTVSIGAAQAAASETLRCLLSRAQKAMQDSSTAGGNQVVKASEGGPECSQS
jgi:diguanylate cyclase (GGDEF)-like protein